MLADDDVKREDVCVTDRQTDRQTAMTVTVQLLSEITEQEAWLSLSHARRAAKTMSSSNNTARHACLPACLPPEARIVCRCFSFHLLLFDGQFRNQLLISQTVPDRYH